MLDRPIHVDTASLAIFDVVVIHGSTLWTFGHLISPFIDCLNQAHAHNFCDSLGTVSDLQFAIDVFHLTLYSNFTPELA